MMNSALDVQAVNPANGVVVAAAIILAWILRRVSSTVIIQSNPDKSKLQEYDSLKTEKLYDNSQLKDVLNVEPLPLKDSVTITVSKNELLTIDEVYETVETVDHCVVIEEAKSDKAAIVKESKLITTVFETSLGNFQKAISKNIEDELKFWAVEGNIVCLEIGWAMPEKFRDRKLEQTMREAIKRQVIKSKWNVFNKLNLEKIPDSLVEEHYKRHSDGMIIGLYRYHTPEYYDLPHFEALEEHKPIWKFQESIEKASESFFEDMKTCDVPCRISINMARVKF